MINKVTVGGIFCDLEKAFSCVNHNILLSRLEFYGIVDKFNALIKSNLKERYQGVLIDNRNTHNSNYSGSQKFKYVVPQDSILGPLFILFYTTDLPEITTKNAKFILYADDTSIIVNYPSPKYFKINMNKVFVDITEWFKINLLSLSFKKTHYLQLRTKNKQEINLNKS